MVSFWVNNLQMGYTGVSLSTNVILTDKEVGLESVVFSVTHNTSSSGATSSPGGGLNLEGSKRFLFFSFCFCGVLLGEDFLLLNDFNNLALQKELH